MSINAKAKLNLLLLAYTVAAFLYLPLAVVLQAGVLIYLFKKREFKYAVYGLLLFVCAIIINLVVYQHELSKSSQIYLIALTIVVFANLFWFAATIKQLKRMLSNSSPSEM